MAALSETHRGGFLAAVIDGRVVCLPKIQAKMVAQVEIDGNLDAREAQRLLRGLLGPFAGRRRRHNSAAGGRRRPVSSGDGRWRVLTLECDGLPSLFNTANAKSTNLARVLKSGSKQPHCSENRSWKAYKFPLPIPRVPSFVTTLR